MGTNFYWKKDLVPSAIRELANFNGNEDSIFIHIGKRSAAGRYCSKCGITECREGSSMIHFVNPPYNATKEQYEEWKLNNLFQRCPACGNEFDSQVCSFTWTMMLHKWVAFKESDNETKMIVDEYGNEYTCYEFIQMILDNVAYERQDACIFG